MNFVSIITVSLNNAIGLQKTIKSVIGQTFSDFEYIIIDGGSTDASLDIMREYEDKISYWVSEPDQGLYGALNKGFAKSTGEIIGEINSDNVLHENSLFKIAELFSSNPNVSWIQGKPNMINDLNNKIT